MDFLCLPILCGCSTRMSNEGNDPRICPRCHNLAVQPAKKRSWFELFCVPVVPYSSDHVWHCQICNWEVVRNSGFEPMSPHQQQHQQPWQQQQQWQQPQQQPYMQPGYGPPPNVPQNYNGPKV